MAVVKRVGVLSLGKVLGVVYAVLGLAIGAIFSVLSLIMGSLGALMGDEKAAPLVAMFFGVGAIVVFPIFYGALGFLGGMLMAAIYNLAARFVGGLEVEIE